MYQLLAMDLDETLFDDNHNISEVNKKYLELAKKKGVHLVACSGRTPGLLGTLYHDLGVYDNDSYSILANGAIVVENKSEKIIFCKPLSFQQMEIAFHFGIQKALCVHVYTTTHVYIYKCKPAYYERMKDFGANIVLMEALDVSFLKEEVILKVLYEDEDIDKLYAIGNELTPIIENEMTLSFSSHRFLEINVLGIHKGIGLEALANHLNIPIKDTIGVGDNHNDKQMIETAGLGIAVANAIDEIKAISDVVLTYTNNQDAIAHVIKDYIL